MHPPHKQTWIQHDSHATLQDYRVPVLANSVFSHENPVDQLVNQSDNQALGRRIEL